SRLRQTGVAAAAAGTRDPRTPRRCGATHVALSPDPPRIDPVSARRATRLRPGALARRTTEPVNDQQPKPSRQTGSLYRAGASWGYVIDLPRSPVGRRRQRRRIGFASKAVAGRAMRAA